MTCQKYISSSVVDYTLVHESLLHDISHFRVHDWLEDISDHCQISFSITAKISVKSNTSKLNLTSPECNFKWDKESEQNFRIALMAPDVQEQLKQIEMGQNEYELSPTNLLDKLTKVIKTTALRALRKKGVQD